ncbi:MAG: hypothetical protein AAF447_20435 [Myxococcota bacterium]
MSYRDDNDALRARVESLEGELQHTRRALDEERERGQAVGLAESPLPGLFSGPAEVVFERDVPQPLDETTVEELVLALRDYTGVLGALETIGRTTEWRAYPQRGVPSERTRDVSLRATERAGATRVRVRQDVAARRRQARSSLRGWGMILLVVSLFAMVPVRGGARTVLVLLVASLPALVAMQRLVFRRSMQGTRAALAAIVDAHLPASARPARARVAEDEAQLEVPASLPAAGSEAER